MQQWPSLSVVVPVRDGARDLPACLKAVLAQEYPGPLEVVVAVGPSSDGTERVAADIAAQDHRVKLVPNPSGKTPAALNAAIAVAGGDVIARVDGQAVIPPGYLQAAVGTLHETGADNVGGIQAATGETIFDAAVAAAMTSSSVSATPRFTTAENPAPLTPSTWACSGGRRWSGSAALTSPWSATRTTS